MDALLHPLFRETLDVLCRPPVIERTPWDEFCERVELRSGHELVSVDDFAAALSAYHNGTSAEDYALEVVARAGEWSDG